MDNIRSQHTPWMSVAGVCWAHYFSLKTTHLMIIMLRVIRKGVNLNLLSLRDECVLSLSGRNFSSFGGTSLRQIVK